MRFETQSMGFVPQSQAFSPNLFRENKKP